MDRPTYERPRIDDFGSLWDNTFMNAGAHGKKGGLHCDMHGETTPGHKECGPGPAGS